MGIVSIGHNPFNNAVCEYDMHHRHSAYLDRKRKREEKYPGEDFSNWDACKCEKCVKEASTSTMVRTGLSGGLNRIKCCTPDKLQCNWCKAVYALETKHRSYCYYGCT